MLKTSTNSASAYAHELHLSFYAQEFHIKRFCSCAQIILVFSSARLLKTNVLLRREIYITELIMRKSFINNGSAQAHTYFRVRLMRKNSIINGSAHGHKLY